MKTGLNDAVVSPAVAKVQATSTVPPSAARCAADLAWLLQSPPLLSLAPQRFTAAVQGYSPRDAAAIAAWLARVDTAHLQAFVAQAMPAKAAMRLGRYAERLMEYFLREAGIYTLAAANVQLKNAASGSDHTTLGEFDYLLHDAQGKPWHWEMAVKFYLCHAQGRAAVPHDFKGPAGADTLALKLGKVFGKQLRHAPPAPHDAVPWQPAAYARGWLFYPHHQAATECLDLNPAHLQGWWLSFAGFADAAFASAHFVHLPRLSWLAPYYEDGLPVLSQVQAAQHLHEFWASSDAKRAAAGQMLACVAQRGGVWVELSRGFVLPPPQA